MKDRIKKWMLLIVPFLAALVMIMFLGAVSHLEDGHFAQEKSEMEDILRRTAVACYAAEGIYPPDLEYMEEHYGIHIDKEKYIVMYSPVASNLMPDITVLEASHEE